MCSPVHAREWANGRGYALGGHRVDRERKIRDARHDLGAKARAIEHTVVPDVRLQPVDLAAWRDIGAQGVRSLGLTDARNVVVLALDRHQPDAADGSRIDRDAAMGHVPFRQRVTDEYGVD